MIRLYDYKLELLKAHPSSTIIVGYNENYVFEASIFASLHASRILGMCKYLISLNGCFLKRLYGGQLLCAVGIYAHDCMVSKENTDNWKWFLQVLAQDLKISDSKEWAFMTNRQKVSELFRIQ